ncbi:hypothetical protein QYM36_013318 [Artemia franciscana]|uniref:Uncharacterized protein n=1 Tax=Artemia franciscana TaxID=6661 RepID=A0AA88HPU4_ARTSF|nr:hypothetical protein QYM36_013318 [Artemia franciscana]
MQARIAPGPRAEVRCVALQKCFSLISTCSATWDEKEDILQSSLVILGSYRALIGSQTEQLAHGVYGLMSILDKPAVSQLLVTLSSGPREVFKMEYETYLKYRKYSGKV